jgi:hypothetical protein
MPLRGSLVLFEADSDKRFSWPIGGMRLPSDLNHAPFLLSKGSPYHQQFIDVFRRN